MSLEDCACIHPPQVIQDTALQDVHAHRAAADWRRERGSTLTRFGTCSFAISVPPGAKGALQTPRYPSDDEVSLPVGCRGKIQVEVEIDLRTGRHEHVQSTATGERIPLDAIAYCKDLVTMLWRSDIRVPRSARRAGFRPRLVVTIPLEDADAAGAAGVGHHFVHAPASP